MTRIVVDARWWDRNGTGSFTRALVRGLAEVQPTGRWLLWGPPAADQPGWLASRHVRTTEDPSALLGQRQAWRVPAGDLVFHPQQIRPIHGRTTASCVLDLIQLHQARGPVDRHLRRAWLHATVRAADALFTIAPSVRDALADEVGVDPATITVLHLPVDRAAADRVAAARLAPGRDPAQRADGSRRPLLAVGRGKAHKNHRRLVEAFASTRFAATGGQLHLVGLEAHELPVLPANLHPGVRIRGILPQAELDAAMVDALALVQPSLLEGYGLPVAEALAGAVPVVSSPIPAVCELGPAGVPLFHPRSVRSIAAAIDETVELVGSGRYWDRVDRASWLAAQPTEADLARAVLAGLEPLVGPLLPRAVPEHRGVAAR